MSIKISFDFDGTLSFKDAQDFAKELIKKGYKVCILTTRYSDPSYYNFDATKEHQELFDVARECGIEEIYFTEFQWKTKSIDDYNIDVHIDDNYREEVSVINYKNKARAILYGMPNWKEKVYKEIERLTT